MALSGRINGTVAQNSAYFSFYIDWVVTNSQSDRIATNASTVRARIYLETTSTNRKFDTVGDREHEITVNGNLKAWMARINCNPWPSNPLLLGEHSISVPHNVDGSKSVAISSYVRAVASSYGPSECNASATVTLDTIPRKSSLTSAVNWTAPNNLAISISRASTSFTHTVQIYVKNSAGTDQLVKTITGVGASTTATFSTAENTAIFNHLAQAASRGTRIRLTTYDGANNLGYNDYTGTCTAVAASTLSSSASFNIGADVSISISRSHTSLSHELNVDLGGVSIADIAIASSLTVTTWSPTTQQKTDMYATTPNSNSIGVAMTLVTKYNGVTVRSATFKNGTATVVNSNPTFGGVFSYSDLITSIQTLLGNPTPVHIVQNESSVRGTLLAANRALAVNGASMVQYVATLAGIEKTAAWSSSSTINFDFGKINVTVNSLFSIKAIDSRGNYTTKSVTVTVLPYAPPVIQAGATRLNNFDQPTTLTHTGTFARLLVSSVQKNVITTPRYRVRPVGGSWGSYVAFSGLSVGAGTYSTTAAVTSLASDTSYDIEFQITDGLYTTTVVKNVSIGLPLFFIDTQRNSVGFNKFPSADNLFDISGNMKVSGNLEVVGQILGALYPVGSIYMSVLSTNPSTYFGGTWAAWGTGRVPVGISTGETEFNTVEKTGGAKTHTLTEAELASHNHTQNSHNHTQNSHNHTQNSHNHTQNEHGHRAQYKTSALAYGGYHGPDSTAGLWKAIDTWIESSTATNIAATATNIATTPTNVATTATNNAAGSGSAHNNLQPYITCYMWKRTA